MISKHFVWEEVKLRWNSLSILKIFWFRGSRVKHISIISCKFTALPVLRIVSFLAIPVSDNTGWQKLKLRSRLFRASAAAAAAKLLQSCPTLCDPIYDSPPGSPVPGILQARTLEWVAISFSNACKWKVKVKSLSRVRLLATPWTAAYQAPPSMGFSRQEDWSGLPLPSLI